MPTFQSRFLGPSAPKYRKHKASGQAVVSFNGHDCYLGPWGSKASRLEYDRLITEWLQNGRSEPCRSPSDLTVVEVANAYRKHADAYYVKNGQRTREAEIITEVIVGFIQPPYGRNLAVEFGPTALKAVRQKMIEAGHSRGVINKNVDRIRRMFRWAASEEMVPVTVHQALSTVAGLRKGRTTAREPQPILPVPDDIVDATLPHLPSVIADMARFQRLSGCRPGEVCSLRPMDLDRPADVWVYRPESHKTEHQGRQRLIFIGPKAQAILLPYLLREASAYCFSPAESESKRHAAMRARRKTRVQPSQQNRQKPRPKRTPDRHYTKDSYNKAIQRACEAAFSMPIELRRISKELSEQERRRLQELGAKWRAQHCWSPNQLRHAAGTEIRRRYGLEAAQVVLGHAKADVTQVYAEADAALAAEVMREVG